MSLRGEFPTGSLDSLRANLSDKESFYTLSDELALYYRKP